MQQISAFSRPQTVPAVPTTVPKKNLWILDSWRDLLFYVGTPLLLVPMFALAQARWSAQGFIFAPIFLVMVCLAFVWWDLKGIVLVVFFWGVWHGMMQTYGFCRIYDAKTGSFAALTRRLDFASCAVWFATAVLLSPQRMADTLETYYASGGPFIPPELLRGAQQALFAAAIAVSILFVANFARMWVIGKRPNPVKLALLATSITFWWYCNNGVANILAGIALFEVFHDVQYLSLVWIYNRNRVEKDSSIGGFMRFVFRRSGSLVGLYIGLVFAYGSLGYFKETEIETIKRFLTGVVAASGLLHFYYDGFIWKVRERSTREHLGLAGGSAGPQAEPFLPSWLLHGLKWVVVFVVPLSALWIGQIRSTTPEVERAASVVQDLPTSERAHLRYGLALEDESHFDEAAAQYRIALRLNPATEHSHYRRGQIFLAEWKLNEAASEMELAVHDDPRNGEIHSYYGYVLEASGRKDEARAEYEKAIQLSPKSGKVHYNYAMFLAINGQLDQAIAEFETALHWKRGRPEAHYHLGHALFLKGDLEGAKKHYLEAARLDPKAPVHNSLGVVYMKLGQTPEAIAEFNEALRLQPNDADAAENLRFALSRDARGTVTPR